MSAPRLLAALRATAPLALALLAAPAVAVDTDALTRDLLRLHNAATERDMAYWLPAAGITALMPSATDRQVLAVSKLLAGYEVFLIARMTVDGSGHATPLVLAQPNEHLRLRLGDGRLLAAERDEDLPPGLVMLATVMRATFDKGGEDGKAMRTVAFRLPRPVDEPRIDAANGSTLTLLLDDVQMTWHLPLDGAGKSAVDPASGEKFPGSYAFNPYTGAPLKHE